LFMVEKSSIVSSYGCCRRQGTKDLENVALQGQNDV